jgi:leucine efflux protein
MFHIEHYAGFVAAILIFQLVPGPGTVAILNATARHGVPTGLGAVLGTLAGDAIYMLAAVLGLAAVLQAHPMALTALQWLGAAYLVHAGWKMWRSADAPLAQAADRGARLGPAFTGALTVALTNPKVILFFVAFFPLFMGPKTSATTVVVMMLHVTVISLLYQVALVLVGHALALRLRAWPWARRVGTRLAGVALIAFGVKLATQKS